VTGSAGTGPADFGPAGTGPADTGPTAGGRFEQLTPEQVEQASIAELSAGRLPVRAQQRLATMRAGGAFTSDLTVDEHHAIRSVGFAPVGQVMGSCVYHIGYAGSWYCGVQRGLFGSGVAQVSEASGLRQALYEARERAMERMRQECAGLGGDGVVAVRLEIRPFSAGGTEFCAIGTAVRAAGGVRPPQPFLSDLSGQDFAKLLRAGWVPVNLALGLAVMVRHDDWRTQRQSAAWVSTEITGYTELVYAARAQAREYLAADCARHGGTGVVVQSMTVRKGARPCSMGGGEQHDHLAEAMVIGTAITEFAGAGTAAPPAPLPVMRLGQRPRTVVKGPS
jgi:uncharacterized protein YbjQ (UPF0145 family)